MKIKASFVSSSADMYNLYMQNLTIFTQGTLLAKFYHLSSGWKRLKLKNENY